MDEREDASQSGGFKGSEGILCKAALSRSKVPLSQRSVPTPSPGGGSDDSQPGSASQGCFTHSLLVATSVWGPGLWELGASSAAQTFRSRCGPVTG